MLKVKRFLLLSIVYIVKGSFSDGRPGQSEKELLKRSFVRVTSRIPTLP